MSARHPSRIWLARRWMTELLLSLRLIFGGAATAATAALASIGEVAGSAALGAAGLLALGTLWRRPTAQPAGPRLHLRIGHLNISSHNKRKAALIRYLADQPQDVVSLIELPPKIATVFESLESLYPHRMVRAREIDGRALLSRWPLSEEAHCFGNLATVAIVETPDGPVRLLQVHPRSPHTGMRILRRDRMIESLATIGSDDMPLLIVGDFNTVGWSPVLRRLAARLDLIEITGIPLPQPTWPSILPMIPIDHLLAPRGSHLRRARTRRVRETDHLGLEIDPEIPMPEERAAA